MTYRYKQVTLRMPSSQRLRLMALLAAGIVTVAVNAARPRLVLGIVIEDLRQEYIDQLRTQFGPDGFNRLLNEGVVIENVDFGPDLDAAAATAVLVTGASPSINGIPGTFVYDREACRKASVYDDGKTVGNFTDQSLSPSALRVTTVSDEARIAGAGVTYVHAIAIQPEVAITLAGHAANSAVWLNDRTGNWAGTTAYTDFPQNVIQRNRLRPLNARIDTMVWTPSTAAFTTPTLPEHIVRHPFRHSPGNAKDARMDAFMASPMANGEVTAIAGELITSLKLGTHDGIDFINVGYNVSPYSYTKTAENRYELVDSYIRLDAQLAQLFRAAELSAGGRDRVVIYLAGTPPHNRRRRDDERWNIPTGTFSTRQAISLLNLYLIALHGNGEWVTSYANNSLYVNTELAKEKNILPSALRTEVADFLMRMSGIDVAYTIDQILNGDAPVDNPKSLRRNTVASYAGDVIFKVIPGWEFVDDFNTPGLRYGKSPVTAHAATTAPAYLLIPDAKPSIITTPVDARVLAPTIARQLHIRSPNGASQAPLRLERK